ncbi:MAG: DUF11 domain-containing protein, partial [Bacteroidales bacterium]|nr:DUF11 domain-containing protein [Bacteroidales bacterium]
MKNLISENLIRIVGRVFLSTLFLLTFFIVDAQVVKPFTQRTSQYSPAKTIYNIKGDFTLLGNTNLTLQNYSDNGGNNANMVFVDIDGDPSTVNSSSAHLMFSSENDAIPDCSEIIYAGLYWTGRAHNGDNSPMSFYAGGSSNNRTNGNNFNGYNLTISSSSSGNNYTAIYTFSPSGGGSNVVFTFVSNAANVTSLTAAVGGGTPVNIAYTTSSSNSYVHVDFDEPFTINTGTQEILISALRKRRNNNSITSTFYATVLSGGKMLNKRAVKIKHSSAGSYETITANSNDIYYPTTQHGQMYSAYAEVTDYVRDHGIGSYTVADIALSEGNGGSTGYYGGWAMIVIYENSKMNWRDVTIFDGHAYVAGSITADYTIPISGFNTAQNGPINMKLGVLAGEGDVQIAGDYLQIQRLNTNNWVDLTHGNNQTNNFFNSSIFTGGNSRNPNLKNNSGLDISMFDIPNSGNSVITNNQTSTSFRYGTTQDTYVIMMLAMSVDAYVPTTEAYTSIEEIGGVHINPGDPLIVIPGNEIEVTVEVRNKGTEAIDNAKLYVPIPFAAEYVSSSKQVFFSPADPNNLSFNPSIGANGSIVWDIGTLPLPADPDELLGTLTFKLKATEDCNILANINCSPEILVSGYMTGKGYISQTTFSNQITVQGYQDDGICLGEPITSPLKIAFNSSDYVNNNCGSVNSVITVNECNVSGSIPITEVSGNFPPGSRFYNEYPIDDNSIEYTISNPFPASPGLTTYYAIPPGASSCFFEFRINVQNITSVPTASPIEYCENDIASPLTATPSAPGNILYYYESESGSPHLSLVPSTDVPGTFIYYVAEGLSGSCISPNKTPIELTVKALPEAPTAAYVDRDEVCNDDTGNITLSADGGSGTTLNWYAGSCGGTLVGTGNNLSIPSPSTTTTYYAAWSNSCGLFACADITVVVLPAINLSLAISNHIEFYNGATGEITATATGGTAPYMYSLNGGTSQLSNVFDSLSAGSYIVDVVDAKGCTANANISITNANQIIANDDAGSINGMDGGTAVANVLDNDLLYGAPVDENDISLSFISSTHVNISLLGNSVVVAPGTLEGTYYLEYKICELANPTNCDNAIVTITVNAPQIIANDDFASGINGTVGATNILNVFDNDLLNGLPVNPVDVTLSLVTAEPTGKLTMNPDGSIDLAPNTPGGSYQLTYRICEVLNPTNCDDAIVIVEVIKTADLSITKSQIDPSNLPVSLPSEIVEINPSVITTGTKIYYYIHIHNAGPDIATNTVVTDIIPVGITNAEFSLNYGNSWAAWNGTRSLPQFLIGGSNYIIIRGDVDPSATGSITNYATIYSADVFDNDLSNNEASVTTTLDYSADLSINKYSFTSPVVIGGPITYQIDVTNNGTSDAHDVIITDNIDPNIISNVEYSLDNGANWASPWTGSINIGSIAAYASKSILIRGIVVDASPDPNVNPIPNTASVSSSTDDPDTGDNEDTILTPLNEDVDITVVKSAPATIIAGTEITYTITVTNESNTFSASNVHVHDEVNVSKLTNIQYSIDGGSTWNTWTSNYVIGIMNPLSVFTILIKADVKPDATGTIVNTAIADTDTPDSDLTNNTSTVSTDIEVVADLEVYKIQIDPSILPLSQAQIFGDPNNLIINPVEATAGGDIYYAVFYENHGPSDATNVILDDMLPGFIVDWEASRCQANYVGWTGTTNLGTIIAGGRCVLVIKGKVQDDATGNLVNTAIISHSDPITDPDLTNNESTFITPIKAMADLSITKTVDNSTPYVGDNITFTVTITNEGPSDALNIFAEDLLPSGYTYISHTVDNGTYNNTTGVWTIASIPYPGTAILTLTAKVNLPGGNNLNIASITGTDTYDPDPDNNTDSETTNPVNVIVANDDIAGTINGYTGATNVLNVFDNDLLNGFAVNPLDLILTVTAPNAGGYLTLNADGSVDVAPGTPAGPHT